MSEDGSVTLPGFVNAHSHAFHRVLRGVSELRSGDFWTWRSLMYDVAERLDPDSYRELATLVFAEMVLAGWTAVGEFHYLHHGPGGTPYADPNEMTWSVVDAAAAAGIRLTLLDACYLQASVGGEALVGPQLRFSDGSGDAWERRVIAAAETGRLSGIRDDAPGPLLGAAIHSVRAVPVAAMASVVAWASSSGAPLHLHLSEQRQENSDCLAATQRTPTDLLGSCGALTARTTVVHATHLTATDVTRIGLAGCGVCACPTTERDLGDGVGPFAELSDSGAVLSLGSDSQAVIDPFEEARSLEWHQRLTEERRGILSVRSLLDAATSGGARALGRSSDGGDSVTVGLGSMRLAGASVGSVEEREARVLFGASAADVTSVSVAGRVVVEGGEHVMLGPPSAVTARLSMAIASLLDDR